MPRARYTADVPTLDDKSTSDSDTDSLFDDEADFETDTDLDNLLAKEDNDNDDDLYDDKVRHPPEHYRANVANLDVQRLRQRRYSLKIYCTFQTWDLAKCYKEISPQFIHGFLSWACDQRRGKGGRRRPGIKYASSLETFWKCYLIVYKIESGRKLNPMIQVNGQDVVKIVAVEKDLDFIKRPSATMYAKDLAEFARVLLATIEMTYDIGWLRIQLVLFCQLAGIIGNRLEALIELRYRHLKLTLIRNPNGGGRPRIFIKLTPEFTKGFLGSKDVNEFKIPKIIYNPTLVLSPHVFLFGMLFKTCAFKSPSIDYPKRLYSLKVLKGLNKQPLPLRDNMNNKFIFYKAIRKAQGVRIACELQVSSGSIRYQIKKVIKRLHNKKQRKRRELLKNVKERYKSKQPVKDSERQLLSMVVDKDIRDALVRANMSPKQLGLINAILTLPGKSPE
ncbi:hypothetical protein IFR04_014697 [Cadophora malorum]|uniref:Uncharacterized protein n=1 Tax=Cadophora malorum TaxID=108018 RepID=A0A8H7VZ90_9HELO|nr:hypothetical protein IFR04_014697 [Cadophora malorum]